MSVSLHVPLIRPMSLAEIEEASSSALQQLLHLDTRTLVRATFDESSRVGTSSTGLLTNRSKRVVCSLAGYEEAATVMPFTVPVQEVTNDDPTSFVGDDYLSVEWFVHRTPLCWALVGAVAVGVAQEQGACILDSSGFFTDKEEQAPSEFCESLMVKVKYTDIEIAAELFYSGMSKSRVVSEWLKSREFQRQIGRSSSH
jgi:hypothetical protein